MKLPLSSSESESDSALPKKRENKKNLTRILACFKKKKCSSVEICSAKINA